MVTFLFIISGGWAFVWGGLSAHFLVQAVVSLMSAFVHLSGVAFSKVSKMDNALGFVVCFVQAIFFAALLLGGNWLVGKFIDFGSWPVASIVGLVSFLLALIYGVIQVPGTLLLVRTSAFVPQFNEAAMWMPRHERLNLARKLKSNNRGLV